MLSKLALVSTLLITIVLYGCGASKSVDNGSVPRVDRSSDNTNAARTNIEELGMLLNIPYETEEANWKIDEGSKRLLAVLRFSTEDAGRIISELAPLGPATDVTIDPEPWFPAELVAQSDLSGDKLLRGTAYPPGTFLQPPYNSGRITRIEGTDYFVLEANEQ